MIRRYGKIVTAAAAILFTASACGDVKTSNKPDVGVKIGPLGGPTTENGGQVAFVVTLRTQPKFDVIIPLSSSDSTEGIVGTSAQLVFTTSDWQSPHAVTVSGVDDEFVDGHASYEIVFGATQSADVNYDGLQIASIPATNLDDEQAGVVATTISGPVTEAGSEATFTLRLTAKPQGIVSIPYSVSDATEGDVDGQSVEFDDLNWNVAQTITLSGVDDGAPDGNQTFTIELGPIFSTDPQWDGYELDPILVVNVDDDAPGITTGAPTGATTESGALSTFTVQLNSQPSANVILSFVSDDATEGSLDKTTLTFTTTNWAAPQTVTVTGEDDDAVDGAINYQVDFDPAVSLDMAYNGLQLDSINLFNADDEVADVTVSPLNGLTTESGSSAMFEVVLAAQPANDVNLAVAVSDSKEARVTPTMITFTAANWDVPVPVVVTGRNDFLPDGHKPYQLRLTPSGDVAYAASGVTTAELQNVDDGPPAKILIFDDLNGTHADNAATVLAFTTTLVSNQTDFLTEIGARPDLIVWESSTATALDPGIEPALSAWLSSGGRLIYSDVDLDGQPGIQALLGVSAGSTYAGARSVTPNETLRGNLFRQLNLVPSPLNGVDVVTGDNGNFLTITSSGTMAATVISSTTAGMIAVTRNDSVFVHGFSPDDYVGTNGDAAEDTIPDMQELYQNELRYLLVLPDKQWRSNNNTPATITTATGVSVPVTVPHDAIIKKARLSFYITHLNDIDLDITLITPGGRPLEVFTDRGSTSDNFGTACLADSSRADSTRTVIDPASSTLVPTVTTGAPYVGTFGPEPPSGTNQDFATTVGTNGMGIWNLRVVDDTTAFNGTVQCWSLMLTFEEN